MGSRAVLSPNHRGEDAPAHPVDDGRIKPHAQENLMSGASANRRNRFTCGSAELSADLVGLISWAASEDADFAVDLLGTHANAEDIESAGRNRYGDFEADAVAGEIQHRYFQAIVRMGSGRR
jgi:hypothetical protein